MWGVKGSECNTGGRVFTTHLFPAAVMSGEAGLSGGDARSRVKVGGRFPFTTEPPLDVSLVPDGGDA